MVSATSRRNESGESGDMPEAANADARLAGLSAQARRQLREARHAIEHGHASIADRYLARVPASAADHPEFLRLLGITRHMQKRRRDAIDALTRAAELQPGDALIRMHLGIALRVAGHITEALANLREACALAPGFAAGWYNLARALDKDARPEEAVAAFERALECDPQHLNARIGRADMLRTQGHIDVAVREYRQALQLPGSMRAWARLANIKTIRFDTQDVTRLRYLYSEARLKDEDRIIAGFALIKALEDQGREADAFALLAPVNALKRRHLPWSAQAFQRRNRTIAAAFATPPKVASPANLGNEVIFIVSLPRSGSTLIEQILASHPDIEGANELPDLWAVIDEESQRTDSEFPAWTANAKPADWRRLGKRYLERTARWRESRPRFTDKALTNWRLIGAAQAMLPGARFVNCRRDPIETTLSCYRQLFAHGQAFSYDLADLAAYWREYDGMLRYWHARYPRRIHDQVYEKLVADPARQVRRLLEFCGLPFHEACLRHHETPRSVRTISSAQVREPLRADTARAHRYGDLLAPLRRALEESRAEAWPDVESDWPASRA